MDKKWTNRLACAMIALVTVIVYLIGVSSLGAVLGYVAAVPALVVTLITAVARLNDIDQEDTSKRWHVRRAGLSIVAASSAAMLFAPVMGVHMSLGCVALAWGFALTWLTTPEMPPWWRWISGSGSVAKGD